MALPLIKTFTDLLLQSTLLCGTRPSLVTTPMWSRSKQEPVRQSYAGTWEDVVLPGKGWLG